MKSTKNIIGFLLLLIFSMCAFSSVIEPIGLEEFAGGTNIPFPKLSKNTIVDFCEMVNATSGKNEDILDPNDYLGMIKDPQGIIIAPANDNKNEDFNMLVMVDAVGDLIYMDAEHVDKYESYNFAKVGRWDISHSPRTFLTNIVSNFTGDFWVINKGDNQIIRVKHIWNGEFNKFETVGIYQLNNSKIVDCYFTDMGNTDTTDDKLYVLTKRTNSLQVINPYFLETVEEDDVVIREYDNVPVGGFDNPKLICGDYNNELGAVDRDLSIIYVLDRTNRILKLKDNGQNIYQSGVSTTVCNRMTEYTCMKSNMFGEFYLIDSKNSKIVKYSNKWEYLYSVGEYGNDSYYNHIQFNRPRAITFSGKEIFITEDYTSTTGVQRFKNKAKILDFRIKGIAYNGYNPQNCINGIKTFPSIDFKLSEECNVKLRIYAKNNVNLEDNLNEDYKIWEINLDTLNSGWNNSIISWDGLTNNGDTIIDNVVFAITTYKYNFEGDDDRLELMKIDLIPPTLMQTPQYNSNILSAIKPFELSLPLNEVAYGKLNIYNSSINLIDTINFHPTDNQISNIYQFNDFTWYIQNLDSCEQFHFEAELEDLAGNKTEIPIAISDSIPVDFINATGEITNVGLRIINPIFSPVSTDPTKRSVAISIDSSIHACDISSDVNIRIYNNTSLTGEPVWEFNDEDIVLNGSGVFSWNGIDNRGKHCDDGDYYVNIKMKNQAGYEYNSKDDLTFDNKITIKSFVPQISLIGSSDNSNTTIDGKSYLYVTGDGKIKCVADYIPNKPNTGSIVVEYYTNEKGSEIVYVDTFSINEDTLQIPQSDLTGNQYTFLAYYVDEIENSGKVEKSTSIINQNNKSINCIYIDNSTPTIAIDLNKTVFTSPESFNCYLFNNTYNIASNISYSYDYSLYVKDPSGTVVNLIDVLEFPAESSSIKLNIPASIFNSDGTYKLYAIISDNYGKASDTAFSYFYLNDRPLEIAVNVQDDTLSGKVYLTGSIGDPNITTNDPENSFDKYLLYYKLGKNNLPSSNLSPEQLIANGWKYSLDAQGQKVLFAPFKRQEPTDTLFPYSNKSVIQTNLQGYASIGYLNTNYLNENTDYTILAINYEKNNNIPKFGTANIFIGSQNTEGVNISQFEVKENGPNVELLIEANKKVNVCFTILELINEDYQKAVAEIREVGLSANTAKTFKWDKKDYLGNLVSDGDYKVIVAIEETDGNNFDWRISNSISLNTDFVVSDISVSPNKIVYPPIANFIADESVATVKFKSNKSCSASIDLIYNSTNYGEVGPIGFLNGGALDLKKLNWDGTGDGLLPDDASNPYKLILTIKSIDGEVFVDSSLEVLKVSPDMESNKFGIPQLTMNLVNPDTLYDDLEDNISNGTSDFIWKTKLKGKKLSTDTVNVSGKIKMSTTQNVPVWNTWSSDNGFEIKVKKSVVRLDSVIVNMTIDYSHIRDNSGGFCNTYSTIATRNYSRTISVSEIENSFVITADLNSDIYDNLAPACKDENYYFDAGPNITSFEIVNKNGNNIERFISTGTSTWLSGTKKYTTHQANVRISTQLSTLGREITKVIKNPINEYPNHYEPYDFLEDANGDLDLAIYRSNPVIDYEYEFVKFPKKGKIAINDSFIESFFVGMFKQDTIYGDFTDWIIKTRSYNPYNDIIAIAPDGHPYSIRDSILPQMNSNNAFLLSGTILCDNDTTLEMHWPFPHENVPTTSLILNHPEIDSIPYPNIAYKTTDDDDPRKKDSTDGSFRNLIGVYQVGHDSLFLLDNENNPNYLTSFNYDITSASPNPLSVFIWGNSGSYLIHIDSIDAMNLNFNSLIYVLDTSSLGDLSNGIYVELDGNILKISHDEDSMYVPWLSEQDTLISQGIISSIDSFSKKEFKYLSGNFNVKDAYQKLTDMPINTGNQSDLGTYDYSFWRGSSDMKRNEVLIYGDDNQSNVYYGPTDSTLPIELYYIDGIPNTDIRIANLDSEGDLFQVKHSPLPTPRKLIEVKGKIDYNSNIDTTYTLNYYDVSNREWNNYGNIKKSTDTSSSDSRTLGYWDITHCNGDYVLKVEVTRGTDSAEVEYIPVTIGEKVYAGQSSDQFVYSPYSKVKLIVLNNSDIEEVVTVIPVDPHEISNVNSSSIPTGPVVEILPSGLLFEEPKPQLSFTLTKDDIDSLRVPLNQLGLVHIYYVDEDQGELLPLETGISKFIIHDNGDTTHITSDQQVHDSIIVSDRFIMSGELEHTSIYGFFNSAGNFTMQPIQDFANVSFIKNVNGSGPDGNSVTVYISNDSILNYNELSISTNVVNETWKIDSLPLVTEGKNYIFAVTSIDGENKILQSVTILDTTAPILTGDFNSIIISQKANKLYQFNASSNENGSVITSVLGDNNASAKEFEVKKDEETLIPVLDKVFTQSKTVLSVKASDNAGNLSEPKFKTIILDNIAPVIDNFNVTINDINIGSITVSANLTDNVLLNKAVIDILSNNGSTINTEEFTLSDQSQTISYPTLISTGIGSKVNVMLTVSDKAGNESIIKYPLLLVPEEDYNDWSNSKKIVIKLPEDINLNESLKSFPLLLRLNEDNFNFEQAKDDGSDIRFVDSLGILQIFEIEKWDSQNKNAMVWINVNEIIPDVESIELTMYWGNSNANDLSWLATSVWDNNYKAVYHSNAELSNENSGFGALSEFAIYATDNIEFSPATVINGNIGCNNDISLTGITAGVAATINGNVTSGGNVDIQMLAGVNGDVTASGSITLGTAAYITGTINQGVSTDAIEIPTKNVNYGINNITVSGETVLEPGNYGSVTFSQAAKLTFKAGVYNLRELRVSGDDSKIVFDMSESDVIEINVQDKLILNGLRVGNRFVNDSVPQNIRFYTNQTSEVFINDADTLHGIIIAPNAHVNIVKHVKLVGSVYAKSVFLDWNIITNELATDAWAFDQTILDATANSNNGINYGTSSSDGIIGTTRKLDGLNDSIVISSDNSLLTPNELTVSGWFNVSNSLMPTASKNKDGIGWNLLIGNDSSKFVLNSDTLKFAYESSLLNWHYFAVTYNGTDINLYQDGDLKKTINSIGWNGTDNNSNLLLGKIGDEFFNGEFDEIRISDIKRSDSWIKYSYETQKENQSIIQITPENPIVTSTNLEDDGVHLILDIPSFITSTIVERKDEINSEWISITITIGQDGSIIDNSATCDNVYDYRVKYINGSTESEWSQPVTVTMPDCYKDSELLSVYTMVLDANGDPINTNGCNVTLNFYVTPVSSQILYSENVVSDIKNGWFNEKIGYNNELRGLIRNNKMLYIETIVNGVIQEPRVPIASRGIRTIKSTLSIKGSGSPIGITSGDIGTLYTDISSNNLYFKFGNLKTDWKLVN